MTKATKKFPVFKLFLALYVCIAVIFIVLIKRGTMQLLEPAGYIANIQSKILWGAILFAIVIASIVIGSVFFVAFHFREEKRARYEPNWSASKSIQIAAWIIPLFIIGVISIAVWQTAHQVDPFQSISTDKRPITIQVVALQWKWLFIYPHERIATVNMLEIPVDTPVSIQLTADAPMNSFWVPQLSGQVFAMTGMVTQLHIEASKQGNYPGSSAEISGAGFAGMDFTVKAVPATEYASWVTAAKQANQTLNYNSYTHLAQPSSYNPVEFYKLAEPNLFNAIVMQFMVPGTNPSELQIKGTPL